MFTARYKLNIYVKFGSFSFFNLLSPISMIPPISHTSLYQYDSTNVPYFPLSVWFLTSPYQYDSSNVPYFPLSVWFLQCPILPPISMIPHFPLSVWFLTSHYQYDSSNVPYSSSYTRPWYQEDTMSKLGSPQTQDCSYRNRRNLEENLISLIL